MTPGRPALARRRTPWALAALGLALALTLFLAARPRAIVALLAQTHLGGLAIAFGWAALVALLRGVRLAIVIRPPLPAARGVSVAAVGQMVVALIPFRLGELALVPLLELSGVRGKIRILSYLVSLRLLDIFAVGLWALATAALTGSRHATAAVALALAPIGALAGIVVAFRLLRRVAAGWRVSSGWRREALRQLLQVRREVRHAARSPLLATGAVCLSAAIWAGIWGLTLALLAAMSVHWPPATVLVGVVGAAIGSSLPVNAIGSFGSLEAGWTAALVSAGIPAPQALATGFATHLWSLVFTALLGLAGAVVLAIRPLANPPVPAQATRD
ncbi:MAG: lysylphosphatidylglycerol synthase domain-containing protein [Acidobacteriota bacterium]